MKKICSTCKEEKDITQFHKLTASRDGYRNICVVCRAKAGKIYRLEYKEEIKERCIRDKDKRAKRMKEYRKNNLEAIRIKEKDRYPHSRELARIRKFGVDNEKFKNMFNSQEGKCAICSLALDLVDQRDACVDHCHKTGKVRGLLCKKCNTGLGLFRDSVEFLNAAINYLADNSAKE